jgi:hypothetical protein
MPFCNPKRFLESLREVPERPGWHWAVGSVGFHGDRGRFVFRPLVGPGLDILKDGKYGRVLLNLSDMVVDTSAAKIEKGKIYLILPREYNHIWAQLYGTCQVGYVIPKRIFLWISDQVINDFMNTYIYRRRTGVRVQV